MRKLALSTGLIAVMFIFSSCPGNSGGNDGQGGLVPGPLAYCVPAGFSVAGEITSPTEYVQGPDYDVAVGNHERSALGSIGDFKLMNNKAEFIVQKADWKDSYFPFGGNLLDAVALNNCRQANPEQFQEMLMLVGKLDIADITSSFLRALSPDSVVVLNDGSDGNAAIVRVHGTEEIFHTVELNLMAFIASAGGAYVSPPPVYLDLTLDYILEPDSNVLRLELNVKNTQNVQVDIMDAMALFFGDQTEAHFPSMDSLGVQGFMLNIGTPWMIATNGTGAWGVSMTDALMSGVNISGLTAAMDFKLVPIDGGELIHLAPTGNAGDTHTFVRYFAVGATDVNSALSPLLDDIMPEPMAGSPITKEPFAGHVYDYATNDPIPNAEVYLEFFNGAAYTFDTQFVTDANGDFSGNIPYWGATPTYRVRVVAPGRVSPSPTPVTFPQVGVLGLPMQPAGQFYYEIRDGDGNLMPAKIDLWQDGSLKYHIFPGTGAGVENVAPGTYNVTVTRGYEYSPYEGMASVPYGGSYSLGVELDRIIDTTGYMSFDGHIHSGRSPDNFISVEERVRSCSAEGLEVSVATDHDFIGSWQWAIDMWGLNKWQVNVAGEEATPPEPGHTNIYPVEPRFDIDARGGWVQWMNLDTAQYLDADRARTLNGQGVVAMNHPRSGITSATMWDPATGTATLADPQSIGQVPTATIWSWNFDTIEYQNSMQDPFKDYSTPTKAMNSGTFEDWMSFLNTGHYVTAVGVSDAHNYDLPGYARSYFRSPTDSPLDFDQADLVSAVKAGKTFVSTGAFARILVDGVADMGDLVTDTDGTIDVSLQIQALPAIDVTYFKVFVNCDEYIFSGTGLNGVAIDPALVNAVVKYNDIFQVSGLTQDATIVVMGFGAGMEPLGLPQFDPIKVPRFTTNAIYIDVDGNGVFDPPGAKACNYTIPLSGAI